MIEIVPPYCIFRNKDLWFLLVGDIFDPITGQYYCHNFGFNPLDGNIYYIDRGQIQPNNSNPMEYNFCSDDQGQVKQPYKITSRFLAGAIVYHFINDKFYSPIIEILITRIYECCRFYKCFWKPPSTNKILMKKRAILSNIEQHQNTNLCLGIYHLPVSIEDTSDLYPYLAVYVPTKAHIIFARADYTVKTVTPVDPQMIAPVLIESIDRLKELSKETVDDPNFNDLRRLILELTFKGPAHKQALQPFLSKNLTL